MVTVEIILVSLIFLNDLILQIFLRILGSVLLKGFAFEDRDVVGKANVEAADARHVADVGGEVPGVLIALLTSNEIFGTRELFDKEVLGHEVELEGDLGGGVA